MDIPFEGQLTQNDYRQAFALHFRPTRWRRPAAVLLVASLLAVALLPLIVRSCGLVCWRGYPWPVWALLALCGALIASDAGWQAFGDLVERNLRPAGMAKGRRWVEVTLAMLLVALVVVVAVLILSLVIRAR